MAVAGTARRVRGRARHEQLTDELVVLFLAEGFGGFTLDDLAARLSCSKSTLYAVGPSKEQLITAVVRSFFRRATERVEAAVAAVPPGAGPAARLDAYLGAIATELAPASRAFYDDLDGFAPAGEIYARNTVAAARRVQEIVAGGSPVPSERAVVLGAVAGVVMEAIQRHRIHALTGLDDAAAYRALADLLTAASPGP